MKLNFVVAAALSALGSVGAHAEDWGTHESVEIGIGLPAVGGFTDYFKFEIAPIGHVVSSTAVANNLGNGVILDIMDGKYSLWSTGINTTFEAGAGDDMMLGGLWDFSGSSGNTTNSVLLIPGNYYYQVTGTASGSNGGFYTLTSTTQPVPEPETYAMMLAGLGALGFLALRRKKG